MKKKQQNQKKLTLSKISIAALNVPESGQLQGGAVRTLDQTWPSVISTQPPRPDSQNPGCKSLLCVTETCAWNP
jgi:hypothetical protein